ncbi:MAG: hypothetical protein ACREDR_18355 [Blastocatellia bacterium]
MYEIVRRALHARPELIAELQKRGMFFPEERAKLLHESPEGKRESSQRLGSIQFATLLAQGDAQLAASAVLRNILTREELRWMERLLKFKPPNGKRDELARIVERAIEGR